MRSIARWHLSARRLVDLVLVALAFGSGLADLLLDSGNNGAELTGPSLIMVALASLALFVRHERPVAVLAFVLAARLFVTWDAGTEIALSFAGAVALYTVVSRGDRRRTLVAAAVVVVVSVVTVALLQGGTLAEEIVTEAVKVLLIVLLADAVRARAGRMQAKIEAEAALQVHAERLRIARDLHDVLAHGMSSITVQSGVAARLIDRDPEHARRSLEIINEAGRESLEELRSMLGVLRSSDELTELRPVPHNPDDLSGVIQRGTDLGLSITSSVKGSFPTGAAEASVVATHRIVEEALTNAARHAGRVAVDVTLDHSDDPIEGVVEIRVLNGPAQDALPDVPSNGVGIIGMRERAEAVGGSLSTRPLPDGGFLVAGVIPYSPASRRAR